MIKVLLYNVLIVSPAGFEPALPKETDLKSVALDHSAIETLISFMSLSGRYRHGESNPDHMIESHVS